MLGNLKRMVLFGIVVLGLISSAYPAVSRAIIRSISSKIGKIDSEERFTTLFYHNNSADLLWYGTDKWAVHFDISSMKIIDSFQPKGARVFVPQEGGTGSVKLYTDKTQPLDSLKVQMENITTSFGWNDIFFANIDLPESSSFWLVFEYETNSSDRYVATSSIGGQNSYYWVPPHGKNGGYFANMAESDIYTELIFNLFGEINGEGYDLELTNFRLIADTESNSRLTPEVAIRNNSSQNVDNIVGVQLKISDIIENKVINITMPYQANLGAQEEATNLFTDFVLNLNSAPSHYRFIATLVDEKDIYPLNNEKIIEFNTFVQKRDRFLIENFVRKDDESSKKALQDQIELMENAQNSVYSLNYFFHPKDAPYYSDDSASQKDFYGLNGCPITVIDGSKKISGHNKSYKEELSELIDEVSTQKTFVNLISGSVKNLIDTTDNSLTFKISLQNSNSYVFPETISNLKMFFGVAEKNIESVPGNTIIYIDKTTLPTINLKYRMSQSFEWKFNLNSITAIQRELSADTFAYFDVVCWLQDSKTKEIFFIESFPLDEFEQYVKVKEDTSM
jgi:hypothetical protein